MVPFLRGVATAKRSVQANQDTEEFRHHPFPKYPQAAALLPTWLGQGAMKNGRPLEKQSPQTRDNRNLRPDYENGTQPSK